MRAANDLLRAYADAIAEPDLRRSFLQNVPEHRELLLPPQRDRPSRRPSRKDCSAQAAG